MSQFVYPRSRWDQRGRSGWFAELRAEFFALEGDIAHLRPLPPGASLVSCPGCGKYATKAPVVIRCKACGEKSFPQVILFWGCEVCGGETEALLSWRDHVTHEHSAPAAG